MFVRMAKITMAGVLLLAGAATSGCSSGKDKTPKMRRLEGVAKQIDLRAGVVSMLWKNDKGKEIELKGTVKEDAEITINGRAHKLEDLREGDAVVVFGFREKIGDMEKLIATRIEVSRPQDLDWKTVGSPTTQPAEGTKPASPTAGAAP
ncbi:MAG TPA: hypothetical protein VJZ71_09990 [Phycisphaerae bacterium]|nr:hypothetical protein [Phycisphaerae bacterium]